MDTNKSNIDNIKPPWTTEWIDNDKHDSFILYRSDGSKRCIKKGDWISLPFRKDLVMVDSIVDSITESVNTKTNTGPIGITFLPWRYDEERLLSVSFTIKGNTRFIICYPSGRNHYGIHVDWDKVECVNPPDNIKEDSVNNYFNNL